MLIEYELEIKFNLIQNLASFFFLGKCSKLNKTVLFSSSFLHGRKSCCLVLDCKTVYPWVSKLLLKPSWTYRTIILRLSIAIYNFLLTHWWREPHFSPNFIEAFSKAPIWLFWNSTFFVFQNIDLKPKY
jgi:hypothetical protein